MNRYSKKKDSNPVAGHRVTRSAGILFVASLLALFMVIAGALPALADDGKVYPGSMGVRYAGTSTPCLNYSAIGNPSANTWLYLDLPVIHDTIGGHIKWGWVKAIDWHWSSNISARLISIYRNGCAFYGWFSPTRYTSGSGCHPQHLSFGSLGANSISHYYYSCKIPPRYQGRTSYIVSYRVEEK